MSIYAILPIILFTAIMTAFVYMNWRKAKDEKKVDFIDDKKMVREEIRWHNEKIYKDFEFYIKVTMAIIAGIGFIILQPASSISSRGAIIGLASIEGISACMTIVSVSTHQACKFKRWKEVCIEDWWRWQEVWMMICIFLTAIIMWIVAWCLPLPK